ncbi:MAG: eukaryotic-like serine/threonine-protein kinase [Frankiaceae bacterium]|nr:eukaryotic-like serine/threonine-protein kinase [Frankiaceae bacterium]
MLEGMTDQERVVAGRYRLTSLLGRGGMGAVWCAHDEVLERTVAIKEVDLPPVGGDEEHEALRQRVLREARTAARLDHPNVVRIFDVAEDAGRPWIVMEVLTGRSLAEEIKASGPLTPERAAEVGLAVLAALEAAHILGVVHRDVKPGNVQLCDDGRVVLTDFGIASSGSDSTITRTGEVVGSPAYMSPERARGEALGPASDLFSLGATLYHAVEGSPPFDRGTPVATLTAVVHDSPGAFAAAGPLRPVLIGMLAKRPEERWDTARVKAALSDVAEGRDINEATQAVPTVPDAEHTQVMPAVLAEPAPVPPTPGDSGPPTNQGMTPLVLPRPRRRLAWGAAALVLLVMAALAGAGYAISQNRHSTANKASDSGGPFDPGQGKVPSDWVVQPGSGWAVATPPDWRKDGTRYRSPRSGTYAYINVSSASGTPTGVLESASGTFGDRDNHEDYTQIGDVSGTTFRGQEAATWEFTYRDGNSQLLHASQLAYLDHGKVWVLWWQTHDDEWQQQLDLRTKVISSFRLT